jgi:hypothetical protein
VNKGYKIVRLSMTRIADIGETLLPAFNTQVYTHAAMNVLDELVGQSSITRRQVDLLSSYLRVVAGEMKLKDAAAIASRGRTRGKPDAPLTIGSYYRTVRQARTNVKEALLTILTALWIGLIRVEDARRLLELVGGGARELTDEEAARFLQLLSALLQRIVV